VVIVVSLQASPGPHLELGVSGSGVPDPDDVVEFQALDVLPLPHFRIIREKRLELWVNVKVTVLGDFYAENWLKSPKIG
jgi:hypothetical protein